MSSIQLQVPFSKEDVMSLHAGDMVYLTGDIYSARDAAHKRIQDAIEEGKQPPFQMEGSVIYYVGPSPARPGKVIGSAGPTTSTRMDKYTPDFLDRGLAGMIGKGRRGQAVKDAIVRNQSVYFAAIGGAGALLSKCIKSSEVIAYEDLGTEAVRKMHVEQMPVIVVCDAYGNDLYEQSRANL